MTPPRPGLALALLRAGLALALALALLRAPLLDYALAHVPAAPTQVERQLTNPAERMRLLPAPPAVEQVAALAIVELLKPEVARWLWLLGLTALLAYGAELTLAAIALPLQSSYVRRRAASGCYFSVRRPAAGNAPQPPIAAPDLFHALVGGLPAGGRLTGRGAWYAFTLGAAPGQPAELGVFVPGGPSRHYARDALLSTIHGLCPEACVEEQPDRLRAALQPGRVVSWRDYGLALPAEYPLRLVDGAGDADPLGPLAAALRPQTNGYVELQVIVRPAGGITGWVLHQGWRGRATALKLALEAKLDYSLHADVAALETKLGGASYEATIRAVAVADDVRSAALALDKVEAALAAFQARTASRLQRLVVWQSGALRSVHLGDEVPAALARAPRYAPPPSFLLPLTPWRPPDILTPDELGGLWHLPTPELGGLLRALSCRRLPAPPHAFTAGTSGGDARVTLGLARRRDGELAAIGPTLRDLRQILHVTAGMGAGKSRLLANLCSQLVPHGFLLIDGKGDDREGSLAATVRNLIPLADEGRLIILDVLDATWPVGLNPLAQADLGGPAGRDLVLGKVLALFARLDPETWSKSVGMAQFATMATLLVLQGEPHPTLAHIKHALLDDGYRARLLEHATDTEVTTFWRVTFAQLGDGQRSSRDALLRRIDLLLTAETTRFLAAQATPTLDLAQAIEQGHIVLVPVPDMTLGGLAGAVATLVFQAFVAAAFARGGTDTSRASYALIVDELQVLLGQAESKDVETAITRLRSLGIPSVYAHQALSQLGDLCDLMLINAANRVMLQTGEPDASTYARSYAASGLTAADIAGQEPLEHQYAALRCEGAPTGVFSLRPLPWPTPVPADARPYNGPDWRTVLPDPPDPLDHALLQMAYGAVDEARAVDELAGLAEPEWERVQARWDAIRRSQRAYILRHPGCIPDRLARQTWLSRLLVARPRLLAAAEYARARPRQ